MLGLIVDKFAVRTSISNPSVLFGRKVAMAMMMTKSVETLSIRIEGAETVRALLFTATGQSADMTELYRARPKHSTLTPSAIHFADRDAPSPRTVIIIIMRPL